MKEPKINIGIISGKEINFVLHGKFLIENSDRIYSGIFKAKRDGENIIITQNKIFLDVKNDIVFYPSNFDEESFVLKNVIIGQNFHWEQKEKESFSGSLRLKSDGNNIHAINTLPLENYLTSVISSEMNPDASIEFLKAHAVISRSWLLAQLKSKQAKNLSPQIETENEIIKWYDRTEHTLFDVCADDHCQRYQGISKVHNNAAIEAVHKTRGIVLEYNNEICDARFSKCCGGITESFENVWADTNIPYLTSKPDYKFAPDNYNTNFDVEQNARRWIMRTPISFCNCDNDEVLSHVLTASDIQTKDFYRWKVEYSQEEISKIIFDKTKIDFGFILDLIPVKRGKSSRIIKLKIIGSKRSITIGKELEIRRVLSKHHLYSSAFVVDKECDENKVPIKFTLYGAGWGHGVGLCQIGAAVMGEKGYAFDEILSHYFSNTRLKKIYE